MTPGTLLNQCESDYKREEEKSKGVFKRLVSKWCKDGISQQR